MQQYFIKKNAPKIGFIIQIEDKDTFNHMFSVMRLKEGDEVQLVFNEEKLALAKVVENQNVQILEYLDRDTELPVSVTIAVGFPKGDKLDFLAQKVTELGADKLWAFPADWSVTKLDGKKIAKRQERLSKICLGAAEQSKRLVIPEVKLFENKANFLGELKNFDHVLVAYEESAKEGENSTFVQALQEAKKGQKILIIFGPEGGISPSEIDRLVGLRAKLIGLGPRIMRAETAPLYALSSISFYLELLNKN